MFTLANVGLPGTSGFVGEFLSLIGTFRINTWVASLATIGTILSAAYALWLYRKVIFGKLEKPSLFHIRDLGWRSTMSFRETMRQTVDWYRRAEQGVNVWALTGEQIEAYAEAEVPTR